MTDDPFQGNTASGAAGPGALPGPVVEAALHAFNHVLGQHDWARQRLVPFAGRTLRIVAGTPLGRAAVDMSIAADGRLLRLDETSPSTVTPSVTMTVQSPLDMLVSLGGRGGMADAMRQVRIDGDAGLAAAIGQIVPHLRWDYEDDLARVMGDAMAHRVGRAVESMRRFMDDFRGRAESATVAYLVHENPTLVAQPMLDAFRGSVRGLRDDLERLEKRVERLERARA